MKRAVLVVGVGLALLIFASLIALSHYDASDAANKTFGDFAPVGVSRVSIRPSRAHGLWIFWRLHFARSHPHMPGDVALWYLHPFRHVELTKDM